MGAGISTDCNAVDSDAMWFPPLGAGPPRLPPATSTTASGDSPAALDDKADVDEGDDGGRENAAGRGTLKKLHFGERMFLRGGSDMSMQCPTNHHRHRRHQDQQQHHDKDPGRGVGGGGGFLHRLVALGHDELLGAPQQPAAGEIHDDGSSIHQSTTTATSEVSERCLRMHPGNHYARNWGIGGGQGDDEEEEEEAQFRQLMESALLAVSRPASATCNGNQPPTATTSAASVMAQLAAGTRRILIGAHSSSTSQQPSSTSFGSPPAQQRREHGGGSTGSCRTIERCADVWAHHLTHVLEERQQEEAIMVAAPGAAMLQLSRAVTRLKGIIDSSTTTTSISSRSSRVGGSSSSVPVQRQAHSSSTAAAAAMLQAKFPLSLLGMTSTSATRLAALSGSTTTAPSSESSEKCLPFEALWRACVHGSTTQRTTATTTDSSSGSKGCDTTPSLTPRQKMFAFLVRTAVATKKKQDHDRDDHDAGGEIASSTRAALQLLGLPPILYLGCSAGGNTNTSATCGSDDGEAVDFAVAFSLAVLRHTADWAGEVRQIVAQHIFCTGAGDGNGKKADGSSSNSVRAVAEILLQSLHAAARLWAALRQHGQQQQQTLPDEGRKVGAAAAVSMSRVEAVIARARFLACCSRTVEGSCGGWLSNIVMAGSDSSSSSSSSNGCTKLPTSMLLLPTTGGEDDEANSEEDEGIDAKKVQVATSAAAVSVQQFAQGFKRSISAVSIGDDHTTDVDARSMISSIAAVGGGGVASPTISSRSGKKLRLFPRRRKQGEAPQSASSTAAASGGGEGKEERELEEDDSVASAFRLLSDAIRDELCQLLGFDGGRLTITSATSASSSASAALMTAVPVSANGVNDDQEDDHAEDDGIEAAVRAVLSFRRAVGSAFADVDDACAALLLQLHEKEKEEGHPSSNSSVASGSVLVLLHQVPWAAWAERIRQYTDSNDNEESDANDGIASSSSARRNSCSSRRRTLDVTLPAVLQHVCEGDPDDSQGDDDDVAFHLMCLLLAKLPLVASTPLNNQGAEGGDLNNAENSSAALRLIQRLRVNDRSSCNKGKGGEVAGDGADDGFTALQKLVTKSLLLPRRRTPKRKEHQSQLPRSSYEQAAVDACAAFPSQDGSVRTMKPGPSRNAGLNNHTGTVVFHAARGSYLTLDKVPLDAELLMELPRHSGTSPPSAENQNAERDHHSEVSAVMTSPADVDVGSNNVSGCVGNDEGTDMVISLPPHMPSVASNCNLGLYPTVRLFRGASTTNAHHALDGTVGSGLQGLRSAAPHFGGTTTTVGLTVPNHQCVSLPHNVGGLPGGNILYFEFHLRDVIPSSSTGATGHGNTTNSSPASTSRTSSSPQSASPQQANHHHPQSEGSDNDNDDDDDLEEWVADESSDEEEEELSPLRRLQPPLPLDDDNEGPSHHRHRFPLPLRPPTPQPTALRITRGDDLIRDQDDDGTYNDHHQEHLKSCCDDEVFRRPEDGERVFGFQFGHAGLEVDAEVDDLPKGEWPRSSIVLEGKRGIIYKKGQPVARLVSASSTAASASTCASESSKGCVAAECDHVIAVGDVVGCLLVQQRQEVFFTVNGTLQRVVSNSNASCCVGVSYSDVLPAPPPPQTDPDTNATTDADDAHRVVRRRYSPPVHVVAKPVVGLFAMRGAVGVSDGARPFVANLHRILLGLLPDLVLGHHNDRSEQQQQSTIEEAAADASSPPRQIARNLLFAKAVSSLVPHLNISSINHHHQQQRVPAAVEECQASEPACTPTRVQAELLAAVVQTAVIDPLLLSSTNGGDGRKKRAATRDVHALCDVLDAVGGRASLLDRWPLASPGPFLFSYNPQPTAAASADTQDGTCGGGGGLPPLPPLSSSPAARLLTAILRHNSTSSSCNGGGGSTCSTGGRLVFTRYDALWRCPLAATTGTTAATGTTDTTATATSTTSVGQAVFDAAWGWVFPFSHHSSQPSTADYTTVNLALMPLHNTTQDEGMQGGGEDEFGLSATCRLLELMSFLLRHGYATAAPRIHEKHLTATADTSTTGTRWQQRGGLASMLMSVAGGGTTTANTTGTGGAAGGTVDPRAAYVFEFARTVLATAPTPSLNTHTTTGSSSDGSPSSWCWWSEVDEVLRSAGQLFQRANKPTTSEPQLAGAQQLPQVASSACVAVVEQFLKLFNGPSVCGPNSYPLGMSCAFHPRRYSEALACRVIQVEKVHLAPMHRVIPRIPGSTTTSTAASGGTLLADDVAVPCNLEIICADVASSSSSSSPGVTKGGYTRRWVTSELVVPCGSVAMPLLIEKAHRFKSIATSASSSPPPPRGTATTGSGIPMRVARLVESLARDVERRTFLEFMRLESVAQEELFKITNGKTSATATGGAESTSTTAEDGNHSGADDGDEDEWLDEDDTDEEDNDADTDTDDGDTEDEDDLSSDEEPLPAPPALDAATRYADARRQQLLLVQQRGGRGGVLGGLPVCGFLFMAATGALSTLLCHLDNHQNNQEEQESTFCCVESPPPSFHEQILRSGVLARILKYTRSRNVMDENESDDNERDEYDYDDELADDIEALNYSLMLGRHRQVWGLTTSHPEHFKSPSAAAGGGGGGSGKNDFPVSDYLSVMQETLCFADAAVLRPRLCATAITRGAPFAQLLQLHLLQSPTGEEEPQHSEGDVEVPVPVVVALPDDDPTWPGWTVSLLRSGTGSSTDTTTKQCARCGQIVEESRVLQLMMPPPHHHSHRNDDDSKSSVIVCQLCFAGIPLVAPLSGAPLTLHNISNLKLKSSPLCEGCGLAIGITGADDATRTPKSKNSVVASSSKCSTSDSCRPVNSASSSASESSLHWYCSACLSDLLKWYALDGGDISFGGTAARPFRLAFPAEAADALNLHVSTHRHPKDLASDTSAATPAPKDEGSKSCPSSRRRRRRGRGGVADDGEGEGAGWLPRLLAQRRADRDAAVSAAPRRADDDHENAGTATCSSCDQLSPSALFFRRRQNNSDLRCFLDRQRRVQSTQQQAKITKKNKKSNKKGGGGKNDPQDEQQLSSPSLGLLSSLSFLPRSKAKRETRTSLWDFQRGETFEESEEDDDDSDDDYDNASSSVEDEGADGVRRGKEECAFFTDYAHLLELLYHGEDSNENGSSTRSFYGLCNTVLDGCLYVANQHINAACAHTVVAMPHITAAMAPKNEGEKKRNIDETELHGDATSTDDGSKKESTMHAISPSCLLLPSAVAVAEVLVDIAWLSEQAGGGSDDNRVHHVLGRYNEVAMLRNAFRALWWMCSKSTSSTSTPTTATAATTSMMGSTCGSSSGLWAGHVLMCLGEHLHTALHHPIGRTAHVLQFQLPSRHQQHRRRNSETTTTTTRGARRPLASSASRAAGGKQEGGGGGLLAGLQLSQDRTLTDVSDDDFEDYPYAYDGDSLLITPTPNSSANTGEKRKGTKKQRRKERTIDDFEFERRRFHIAFLPCPAHPPHRSDESCKSELHFVGATDHVEVLGALAGDDDPLLFDPSSLLHTVHVDDVVPFQNDVVDDGNDEGSTSNTGGGTLKDEEEARPITSDTLWIAFPHRLNTRRRVPAPNDDERVYDEQEQVDEEECRRRHPHVLPSARHHRGRGRQQSRGRGADARASAVAAAEAHQTKQLVEFSSGSGGSGGGVVSITVVGARFGDDSSGVGWAASLYTSAVRSAFRDTLSQQECVYGSLLPHNAGNCCTPTASTTDVDGDETSRGSKLRVAADAALALLAVAVSAVERRNKSFSNNDGGSLGGIVDDDERVRRLWWPMGRTHQDREWCRLLSEALQAMWDAVQPSVVVISPSSTSSSAAGSTCKSMAGVVGEVLEAANAVGPEVLFPQRYHHNSHSHHHHHHYDNGTRSSSSDEDNDEEDRESRRRRRAAGEKKKKKKKKPLSLAERAFVGPVATVQLRVLVMEILWKLAYTVRNFLLSNTTTATITRGVPLGTFTVSRLFPALSKIIFEDDEQNRTTVAIRPAATAAAASGQQHQGGSEAEGRCPKEEQTTREERRREKKRAKKAATRLGGDNSPTPAPAPAAVRVCPHEEAILLSNAYSVLAFYLNNDHLNNHHHPTTAKTNCDADDNAIRALVDDLQLQLSEGYSSSSSFRHGPLQPPLGLKSEDVAIGRNYRLERNTLNAATVVVGVALSLHSPILIGRHELLMAQQLLQQQQRDAAPSFDFSKPISTEQQRHNKKKEKKSSNGEADDYPIQSSAAAAAAEVPQTKYGFDMVMLPESDPRGPRPSWKEECGRHAHLERVGWIIHIVPSSTASAEATAAAASLRNDGSASSSLWLRWDEEDPPRRLWLEEDPAEVPHLAPVMVPPVMAPQHFIGQQLPERFELGDDNTEVLRNHLRSSNDKQSRADPDGQEDEGRGEEEGDDHANGGGLMMSLSFSPLRGEVLLDGDTIYTWADVPLHATGRGTRIRATLDITPSSAAPCGGTSYARRADGGAAPFRFGFGVDNEWMPTDEEDEEGHPSVTLTVHRAILERIHNHYHHSRNKREQQHHRDTQSINEGSGSSKFSGYMVYFLPAVRTQGNTQLNLTRPIIRSKTMAEEEEEEVFQPLAIDPTAQPSMTSLSASDRGGSSSTRWFETLLKLMQATYNSSPSSTSTPSLFVRIQEWIHRHHPSSSYPDPAQAPTAAAASVAVEEGEEEYHRYWHQVVAQLLLGTAGGGGTSSGSPLLASPTASTLSAASSEGVAVVQALQQLAYFINKRAQSGEVSFTTSSATSSSAARGGGTPLPVDVLLDGRGFAGRCVGPARVLVECPALRTHLQKQLRRRAEHPQQDRAGGVASSSTNDEADACDATSIMGSMIDTYVARIVALQRLFMITVWYYDLSSSCSSISSDFAAVYTSKGPKSLLLDSTDVHLFVSAVREETAVGGARGGGGGDGDGDGSMDNDPYEVEISRFRATTAAAAAASISESPRPEKLRMQQEGEEEAAEEDNTTTAATVEEEGKDVLGGGGSATTTTPSAGSGGSGGGDSRAIPDVSHSLLLQLMDELSCYRTDLRGFFQRSDGIFFSVKFVGEGSTDYGGPFRELITDLAAELTPPPPPSSSSSSQQAGQAEGQPRGRGRGNLLGLFIPTPNNESNVGEGREFCLPDPARANSMADRTLYVFVGMILGGIVRSDEYFPIPLPSLFWKFMTGEERTIQDLAQVDSTVVTTLRELLSIDEATGCSDEDFTDFIDGTFVIAAHTTTTSSAGGSGGRLVVLCKDGETRQLTLSNREEYVALALQAKLHEYDLQLSWIKEGMLRAIPPHLLALVPHTMLSESMIAGSQLVSVEALRAITATVGGGRADGDEADGPQFSFPRDLELMFWEAIGDGMMTNSDRQALLKFVSGRSRLPIPRLELHYKFTPVHTTTAADSGAGADDSPGEEQDGETTSRRIAAARDEQQRVTDRYLPVAHTCFYQLELPHYSSARVMRERLLYAVYNCNAIDMDYNPHAFEA